VKSQDYVININYRIRGNANDFIDHSLLSDSVSAYGAPPSKSDTGTTTHYLQKIAVSIQAVNYYCFFAFGSS